MERPSVNEEGAKMAPEIKEKAAEKGRRVDPSRDFASSSKFCKVGQINENDLSTGVPESIGAPVGSLGYIAW